MTETTKWSVPESVISKCLKKWRNGQQAAAQGYSPWFYWWCTSGRTSCAMCDWARPLSPGGPCLCPLFTPESTVCHPAWDRLEKIAEAEGYDEHYILHCLDKTPPAKAWPSGMEDEVLNLCSVMIAELVGIDTEPDEDEEED